MPLYNKEPQVITADFRAGDGEVTLYVWPMNLYEMDKLQDVRESSGNGAILAAGLMLRARDENQQKVFPPGEATTNKILTEFDTDEVVRVVSLFDSGPTEDEVEK